MVTLDVLEPIIISLKKLEEYEFAEQLSPEERDNICRVVGKFVRTEEINPPVISGLNANVTSTSVTISWATGEPATSQLLFGSSTAMTANVPVDPSLVTSHSIQVSYLAPGTTYYYAVESKDASGNAASSSQQSLMTKSP